MTAFINTKLLLRKAALKISPLLYQTINFREYGLCYYRNYAFLKKTEYWPLERIRLWQFGQVKKILHHAYDNIPFYGEVFRKAGLNPDDINTEEDFRQIPFLTKQQYRENMDRLLQNGCEKENLVTAYTGGTMGIPLSLYRAREDAPREAAFSDYVYYMLGMDNFSRMAFIRGSVDDKNGRYYRYSADRRVLYLSGNNLSDKNLGLYIQLILEFRPNILYALPSIAEILSDYMMRSDISPIRSIKWALCPSENLYDFQREKIEKMLGCRVGTFYGHSEHAVMASQCLMNRFYHVLPQYGYAELIDRDGRTVCEDGKIGEIVGTSFTNTHSPFIRYRTGDYAVYTSKKCSCGRSNQLWEKIEGRGQALAVSGDNSKVSIGPELLCTIRDNRYGEIKQFQIVQEKAGELLIRFVQSDRSDVQQITGYFQDFFNDHYPGRFKLIFEQNENLISGKETQKHLYFVQKIREQNSDTPASFKMD